MLYKKRERETRGAKRLPGLPRSGAPRASQRRRISKQMGTMWKCLWLLQQHPRNRYCKSNGREKRARKVSLHPLHEDIDQKKKRERLWPSKKDGPVHHPTRREGLLIYLFFFLSFFYFSRPVKRSEQVD